MANKCLVTRLKAVIQNDDLPVFDTIKLPVSSTGTTDNSSYKMGITTVGDGVIVKVNGSGYFATTLANLSDETKRMTETTIASSSSYKYLYFVKGDYDVFIQNAHNLNALSLEGTSKATPNKFNLNLSELKNNPGIVKLNANQSSVYGDINDIPLTLTDVMAGSTPNITGNINTVASRILFSRIWISGTNITGSIEALVAGQVAQGATEGNMSVRAILSILTFGGIIQNANIIGERLEWNGNDRILVGCHPSSSTQPPASMDDANIIYAKGATSEEISAWETAGKTVVVITDEDGE